MSTPGVHRPPLRRHLPTATLPVASALQVRAQARVLLASYRKPLLGMLLLNGLAALAALAGPRLLGDIVQSVQTGTTTAHIDRLAMLLAGALVLQTTFTWWARRSAFVLGETVFATLRERYLERVLGLPLSAVERAGTGDLVTRSTGDVEALARTVRFAVPEVLVASLTVLMTGVAAFLTAPLVALPLLGGAPLIVVGTRWYLRRAPEGYLAERECYAAFNGSLAETVDGARTVEALSLGGGRIARLEDDLADAYAAECYTLRLRTFFFPTMELAYAIPVTLSLLWGGWLVSQGNATLAEVTTITLYARADGRPGRPAGVLAGRGPGRRHRAVPHPRRRAGAGRPGRGGRGPGGRARPGRRRAVRLPGRPRRPARHRPRPPPGRAAGRRRPLRGRASRPWAGCWPASTRPGPAR